MKQRNSIKKLGSLYLLACLILLSGFSPFAVAQAAPDSPIYQVVFDPEDGSSYHNWHKASIPEGGRITDPPADPQKEGFIFEGWAYAYDENDTPVLWNFAADAVSENTTLWAVWGKACQIVFDPEDGTGYSDWYKVTIPAGGKITDQPADPQKEGFVFEGWAYAYDENGIPVLWNFETDAVSENTTLWAVWENGTIVAFDPDDGKATYPDFYKAVVKPGHKVTDIPADPQREGYVFEGWAYAYDENGTPLLWDFNRPAGEKNMTLWASWTKEDNGNHAGIGNGTTGADNNSAGTIQDKTDTTSKNPATGKEGNYFLGFLAVLGVLSFGALALLKHQR